MSSLNDFKIINNKSRKYFQDLQKFYPELTENIRKTKEKQSNFDIEYEANKMGFYLFVLELITNIKDISELAGLITDTEFNKIVFNKSNDDMGIDAVNIDTENSIIQLFTFKFREKFNKNKGMSSTVIDSANTFLSFLQSPHNLEKIKGSEKTRDRINEIQEKYDSSTIWHTELIVVSNESKGLNYKENKISNFDQIHDIEIKDISLDDITAYLSDKPRNINAEFLLDSGSILTYEPDKRASSKSYLLRMNIATLIRITNTDPKLRETSNLEDFKQLENRQLETGLLYDNVRGYLGDTKYNKNIITTLHDEPENFFMYNNGLTITVDRMDSNSINGGAKYKFNIGNFQIVNGGQTLRTIYSFNDEFFDENIINNAEILVRLFQTSNNDELTNNIAEYTNSQNAISSSDLKSISNEQIQIEKYLESNNIRYIRKVGNTFDENSDYKIRISMEYLAQILYSYNVEQPARATNQKKKLFEKYYDDIFKSEVFDFEVLPNLIVLEKRITDLYKDLGITDTKQKNLYILYIIKKKYNDPINNGQQIEETNIKQSINILEQTLEAYINEHEGLSPARALIQVGFKEQLDKENGLIIV